MSAARATGLMAEFGSADALVAAIDALHREGYHTLDAWTPFDVPELDARLGLRRSRLPAFVLAGGIAGLVIAYGIQWYANVFDYPMNVGGRPVHAVPAFLLATFEGTVLGAALAAFFGLLLWLRLPRLWAPVDEVDGFTSVTRDRFWLAVGTLVSDVDRAHAEQLLRELGAERTVVRA